MGNQQVRHVYISYEENYRRLYIGSHKGPFKQDNYLGSYTDETYNPQSKLCYSEHSSELIAMFVENNLVRCWGQTDRFVNAQKGVSLQELSKQATLQHQQNPNYSQRFQNIGTQKAIAKWYSLTQEERDNINAIRREKSTQWHRDNLEEVKKKRKEQWANMSEESKKSHALKASLNNSGAKNAMAKAVQTPIGWFGTKKAAAKALGISTRKLNTLIKTNPNDYYESK